MTVHQLVASAKAGSKVEITTKCGEVRSRKTNDPFPVDVTGWDSQVTCSACKP